MQDMKQRPHRSVSQSCISPLFLGTMDWEALPSSEKIAALQRELKQVKSDAQKEKKRAKDAKKKRNSLRKAFAKKSPPAPAELLQKEEPEGSTGVGGGSQEKHKHKHKRKHQHKHKTKKENSDLYSIPGSIPDNEQPHAVVDESLEFAGTCAMTSYMSKIDWRDPRFTSLVKSGNPEDALKLEHAIGCGSSGSVWLARSLEQKGEFFAVKMINSEGMDQSKLRNEALILNKSQHPNIVKFIECYVSERPVIWIVLELCTLGTFAGVIRNHALLQENRCPLTPRAIFWALNGLLAAIEFFHAKGFIHRDIKSDNLLFAGDGTPKLADFGFAAPLLGGSRTRNTVVGTPYWMAPEVIKGKNYNDLVDIWSFGVVIFEAVTGNPPYYTEGGSPVFAMQLIARNGITLPRPEFFQEFPKATRNMLADCLSINPLNRPNAKEIRNAFGKLFTTDSAIGMKELIECAGIVSGSISKQRKAIL